MEKYTVTIGPIDIVKHTETGPEEFCLFKGLEYSNMEYEDIVLLESKLHGVLGSLVEDATKKIDEKKQP